jgi:hypothetical protein
MRRIRISLEAHGNALQQNRLVQAGSFNYFSK